MKTEKYLQNPYENLPLGPCQWKEVTLLLNYNLGKR